MNVLTHRNQTTDTKKGFSSGQRTATIDSTTRSRYEQQSIATLLSQQLPVFIKSYSFNGLATLSFRGSSAAQSQVYWNGVPIRNTALGVADVSSLPVLLFRNVSVTYGGSGALYGSGNVGGALLLNDLPPTFDSGHQSLSASVAAGSFGQLSAGITGSASGRKWFASATGFSQRAANDYLYHDQSGTSVKMPNGYLQNNAAALHGAYRFDTHNTISLSAWLQQYDREIPPALFEPYSLKRQEDRSSRLLVDWQHKKKEHLLYARASLVTDRIRYSDSSVGVSTNNRANQYFQEVGMQWLAHEKLDLLLFSPVQISWLPARNDTQQQRQIAIAGAGTYKPVSTLSFSLQGRAENINGKNIFLPGTGITCVPFSWLALRVNAQRTYRLPSLNELYYFPGGNPQLRPERGWSFDGGYTVYANKGILSLKHEGTAFTRRINDWIVWLGGAIWTPHNIATVHSRGTETDTKLSIKLKPATLHISVSTAYVVATTASSDIPGDGSLGMQIPYVPRYNGRANLGVTFRRFFFNYNHTYTGYRFTALDESAWLTPYQTGNIQASYSIKAGKAVLTLNVQCNNIWNASYAITAFRPMPGRNWLIGGKVSL
ncbi:MAG: TonB-dependent receptor [Taibaiella sp.]|nr:TonB-dependent receptor [Taibaiella sp.]